MRTTCVIFAGLMIAGGCHVQQASAQTKDGPFQRLVNFFSPKTKSDTIITEKEVSRPAPKTTVQTKSTTNTTVSSGETPADSGTGKGTAALPMTPGPKAPLALPSTTETGSAISPTGASSTGASSTGASSTGASSTKPAAPITTTAPAPTTATKPAPPLNSFAIQRLTRQVAQVCPKARNIKIVAGSGNEVTVELEARTADECNELAERIFTIRDLDPYRVNLKFNVAQK